MDTNQKDMEKILQELELIKTGQEEIQDSQKLILERVGAVEFELGRLKNDEVQGLRTSQETVTIKVDLVGKKFAKNGLRNKSS